MKKLLLVLLFATLFALGGCDNNDSEDVLTAVDSGVDLSNGKRIFVLDRNVGAVAVGKKGIYMRYARAINACPLGYHLMTRQEANSLCAVFDTPEKMRDGILKMPLPGFENGIEVNMSGRYYLYLDDESFDDPEYRSFVPYIILVISKRLGCVEWVYTNGGAHQVRCVKNYE